MSDKQNASYSGNAHPVFCPKCGYKNKEKAKYCASCGYKIPDRRADMSQSKTIKNQQSQRIVEDDSEVTQMLMPEKQQSLSSKSAPAKQAPSQNKTIKKVPAFEAAKKTDKPNASEKKSQAFDKVKETKPERQKSVLSSAKLTVSSKSKNEDKSAFSPINDNKVDVSQKTKVADKINNAAPVGKQSNSVQSPAFKTETLSDQSMFETKTLPDQSMFDTETIKEPVSVFAQGLPDWTVTPPQVPVRRKRRK